MDSSHATREQDAFDPGADARYVYLNRNQEHLLVALVSAISNGRERLLITGGEGAGKSAFLWKLAEVLYASGEFALLGHEMVFSCHRDTPVEAIETAVREHTILRDQESAPPAVLLLDDADRLDPTVLVSLWQRWPTLNEGWSSMCVVMSAMPRPKQLHGRHGHEVMAAEQTFALPPLEPADVGRLIRHRLQVAGLSGRELFSPDALERIDYFSKRVPGRIVQLCEHIFSKSKKDLSLPVSEEAVKEAAYDLFLPGHLQKLARGLAPQPKSSPHGVSNIESRWNVNAFASGRGDRKRDADTPHDDAPVGPVRWHGERITTPPAFTAAGRPPQRVWQPRMGVRSLASVGVILLLFAATVFFALGERQSDRVTEPAPEAAIAPSEQQAPASHQTEPAPDAGQDRNAADPLAIPDRKQDPVLHAPAPAAALPEVVAKTTGVANVDPATNSTAPDRTLAAVEPRRPPPLVELNNVALAQSRLNALGYRAGSVDGVVGPRTRAAIRRFQAKAGLPVDGKISEPLIAALRRQSTKSNLRTQGREKPRRRIMPALRLQLDSVKQPEALQEYCRENRNTWVFDPRQAHVWLL
jgi:type II secretory pathway predicted ATPase ExeA